MKTRQGKFRPDPEDLSKLPPNVQEAMRAEAPDWDWTMMGDGKQTWLILRCFDGGIEQERVAAVVKVSRFLP